MDKDELKHGQWLEVVGYPLPNFPGIVFQLDLAFGENPVIYMVYYPVPGRTISEHVQLHDLLPYLREVEQPTDRTGFNPKETLIQQQKRSKKRQKQLSKWIENQGKELV
jgi:hypothetical protein